MKKVLVAVAIFAGASIMTSCKKDYTCSCTATDSFWDQDVNYVKVKKKTAQASCDLIDANASGIEGWSCELK